MRILAKWSSENPLRQVWHHFNNDSQFRNSIYIMLSTGMMSGLGFIFWIFCSKLYSPEDIGLATSVISGVALMTGLSVLGLNNVLIRFLPTSKHPTKQISTAITLSSIVSLASAGLFLAWASWANNPIIDVRDSYLQLLLFVVFISFVFASTISTILDSIFIANRAAKNVLIKSSLLGTLKIFLLFGAMSIGFIGIIGAITMASVVACIFGFIQLHRIYDYRLSFEIDKETVSETRTYAFGNYLGNIFGMLPSTLLPLIIVSRLGTKEAAFFYMPMMIIALLNVIPSATAQSLFAEVAHDEINLTRYFSKALKNLFLLFVPAIIAVWLFGYFVLSFFGPEYAEHGIQTLQILALASLIGALNYLGDTLLNIKKKIKLFVTMNLLNAVTIVILVYLVAPQGLTAIALAYLIGQAITITTYTLINWPMLTEYWNIRRLKLRK